MILKYYLTSCQTEGKGLPIISKLPLHAYKHDAYLVVRREHTLVAVILGNDNNTLSIVTRSGSGGGALPALVPSHVGHVRRPPINLLYYCKVLLNYCI